MWKLIYKLLLLWLLVLPTILRTSGGDGVFVNGEEDILDDDEGRVETDEESDQPPEALTPQDTADDDDDDDDNNAPLKPSPDADTFILFTKPTVATELPVGSIVEFLVGFTNKGSNNFILNTLDASFRYPMDYSFYIQNFSTVQYNRVVKPRQQVTLLYSFFPNEAFAGRPFGLTVNLNYHDAEGNQHLEAVFNETVNVIELDEGLDGETIFLYVFLVACVVLAGVGIQQFVSTSFLKKKGSKTPYIETGTSNHNDVDYDWLPTEVLQSLNKSPRRSPRQSVQQRRQNPKRGKGVDD